MSIGAFPCSSEILASAFKKPARESVPPVSAPRSGPAPRRSYQAARPRRILIADSDAAVRAWLLPALQPLCTQVVEARTGVELEQKLAGATFDLVVAGARLPAPSGIAVLAKVRAAGGTTPFIVVTSYLENRVCIFVSDAEGTVLSSRVVDAENLAQVAGRLLDSVAPPSQTLR